MRSLQILYVFVLRAEVIKTTTFGSKVLIFSLRFYGTSLDVENFLKGLKCLSIEWKLYTFRHFFARNTIVYKICKLRTDIFSLFYNISRPNFVILLILRCSF